MPASVSGSFARTPDQNGSSWTVNVPALTTGQTVVIGFGAWCINSNPPTLTGSGYNTSPTTSTYYGDFSCWSGFFMRTAAASGSVGATTVTINWPANATGSAFAVAVADGEFDVSLVGGSVDTNYVSTRTLGSITASQSGSLRFETFVTIANRALANSVLTEDAEWTYTVGGTGGIGVGMGYKSVSSGATTGEAWTWTDPDGGDAGSPSVASAIIIKPAAAGTTNPTMTGTVYAPDQTAQGAPNTPANAPSVTVLNSDEVSFNPGTYDPAADTLHINMATVTNGVVGTFSTIRVVPTSGASWPLTLSGLTPNTTYRFSYHLSLSGVPSSNSSPVTGNTVTKRLLAYLLVDSSAAGTTGVTVQVWRNPSVGFLAGETLLSKTGAVFDTPLVSGQARLQIEFPVQPVAPKLRNGGTVVACAMKDLGGGQQVWTRIASSTIAEV